MMPRISKGLMTLTVFCLMALPRPSVSAEGPCAADAKKFCANLDKKSAVGKCLKEHESQLSSPCKTHLAKVLKQAETRKACAADVTKFCSGVQPGGGRVGGCLKQHESELSADCKKARSASPHASAAKAPPNTPAPSKTKSAKK